MYIRRNFPRIYLSSVLKPGMSGISLYFILSYRPNCYKRRDNFSTIIVFHDLKSPSMICLRASPTNHR